MPGRLGLGTHSCSRSRGLTKDTEAGQAGHKHLRQDAHAESAWNVVEAVTDELQVIQPEQRAELPENSRNADISLLIPGPGQPKQYCKYNGVVMDSSDRSHMERAVEEARRQAKYYGDGVGEERPSPLVGCVIVTRDGRVESGYRG